MRKVRWGVLGVAKIATEKVIPAMQRGEWCDITAIASRDASRAQAAAGALGIPKAYGSYEALIADPDVDAIYNPLPNHLHVPWSIRAAESGKHVLCEKPIALSAAEARGLLDVRERTGVQMAEAFMVRTHPQWVAVREVVRSGRIGELRSMSGYFSYFNRDAQNIRNIARYGGGALMDVGCYLIHTSRWVFGRTPARVIGLVERDPDFDVDILTSMMMDFDPGQSIGTCSTQVAAYQRMHIIGSRGRVELEIPFNAPPDRPCRVVVDTRGDLTGEGAEVIEVETCDQYRIQGDLISRAIREGGDVAVSLEDAITNMEVIEAVIRSSSSGRWERPGG